MSVKNWPYMGWVPCLCGRLFFDLSACGLSHNNVFAAVNHVEADQSGNIHRRILIASDVDWKDSDDHGKSAGQETWSGVYHAILLAEQSAQDTALFGKVHLIPEHETTSESWETLSNSSKTS